MSAPRALVTGGSSGIGLAICEQLVADGWQVLNFDLNAPPASAACEFEPVDMGDRESLARALARCTAAGDTHRPRQQRRRHPPGPA